MKKCENRLSTHYNVQYIKHLNVGIISKES